MKSFGVVGSVALSALCSAQSGALGTKADLVKSGTTGSAVGAWDLVQMIFALAVVFALLKWALPKLVTKLNKKMGSSSSESIRMEESAMFAGCQLQIVTVRGRTLLLGSSQAGVTCLADLTQNNGSKDEPAFFELVDKAIVEPLSEDMVALDRLNRLAI